MRRTVLAGCLVLALVTAGCGGGSGSSDEPTSQVPTAGGLREKVAGALRASTAGFPAADGKTLQQLADGMTGAGTEAAMASSQFDVGRDRVAFGVLDGNGSAVYGQTAVYIARSGGEKAIGPFAAPADVLLTQARYRSRQAATENDPFAAVYATHVRFPARGKWAMLVATKTGGRTIGTVASLDVSSRGADPIPQVGDMAPRVATDTLASARGDVSRIDTRVPPSTMHERSLTDVLGKKPVALLFATPQLCQSRVCGPVTDIALQMRAKYGKRMEFIHQEVYVDNDPNKGLREPLRRFNLRTEPWLFVIDKSGRITARLEGSFGVSAFEQAVRTGL